MIDQEMQHCRKIVRFDPTISTANQGDFIIRNACEHVLHDCFPVQLSVAVPVRDRLSKVSMKHVGSADYAFVCGTNLLSSDMRRQRMWNIRLRDAVMMRCGDLHKRELLNFRLIHEKFQRTHVILLGAGWYQYQDEPTGYTKRILKTLLDGQYLHAVRDEYTRQRLLKLGITNVLNTACPTMWGLTDDKCAQIPTHKAERVVTTLTDYRSSPDQDEQMLTMLQKHYREVYVWLQAVEDYACLRQMDARVTQNLHLIQPNLRDYTALLASGGIDYVGTRLHGGIHAMNMGCRSLILAVDNRASEIAKDTNLPVLPRGGNLDVLEERICVRVFSQRNVIRFYQHKITPTGGVFPMIHHFFAYIARLRYIRRWGLMRSSMSENDAEHSLQVAMLAHGMALIGKNRYGRDCNPSCRPSCSDRRPSARAMNRLSAGNPLHGRACSSMRQFPACSCPRCPRCSRRPSRRCHPRANSRPVPESR